MTARSIVDAVRKQVVPPPYVRDFLFEAVIGEPSSTVAAIALVVAAVAILTAIVAGSK